MSNTDQNKDLSWRNRLDMLDSIPGEVMPVSIAWEKLHGRLREKKESKRSYWYWAAAVFFISLISGLVLMNAGNKKQGAFVQQNIKERSPLINNVTTGLPSKIAGPETNAEKENINNITAVNKSRESKTDSNEMATNNKPTHSSPQIIITTDPAITIVNSFPVIDSTSIVVVPKKKLRVVHLNEIYDTGKTNIAETDNTNNGFRRFIRHYNKDVSVGNPAPSNPREHILIKNLNAQN